MPSIILVLVVRNKEGKICSCSKFVYQCVAGSSIISPLLFSKDFFLFLFSFSFALPDNGPLALLLTCILDDKILLYLPLVCSVFHPNIQPRRQRRQYLLETIKSTKYNKSGSSFLCSLGKHQHLLSRKSFCYCYCYCCEGCKFSFNAKLEPSRV